MLLYKDFETMFSNPHIWEKLETIKTLYSKRHDSDADKMAYNRDKKELKIMIERAK